jgi:hypothetical protein
LPEIRSPGFGQTELISPIGRMNLSPPPGGKVSLFSCSNVVRSLLLFPSFFSRVNLAHLLLIFRKLRRQHPQLERTICYQIDRNATNNHTS